MIKNYDTYCELLNNGMEDKLFFVPFIDEAFVVDYGCADGRLMKALRLGHNIHSVGYDTSPEMLDRARKNACLASDSWREVIKIARKYNSRCLVLSSVLHELDSLDEIKSIINSGFFHYVAIRDMSITRDQATSQAHRVTATTKEGTSFLFKWGFWSEAKRWRVIQFTNRYGYPPTNLETFLHFILKYRYVDNWDREVEENYLRWKIEDIRDMMEGYEEIHFEHLTHDYTWEQVHKDFDPNIERFPTHIQAVYKL